MNDVQAVVVTWNGEHCVSQCLESLQGSSRPVRILVVDNASTDGTVELVRRVSPRSEVLRLSENLGFGRANNIGIKRAYDGGADHVLLLNQDAWVEPEVVEGLARAQRSRPEYGVLCPAHWDGSGEQLDALFSDHVSRGAGTRGLLSDLLLGREADDIYDVSFVNAAAWMLSRACVERVGLFNPAFPHYGEDREYVDRVSFRGLKVGLKPRLRAFHARVPKRPGDQGFREKRLMLGMANIRYKLSRWNPGTAFNLMSAVSEAALSTCPGDGPAPANVGFKASLLTSLLRCGPEVLRNRRIAYRTSRCFFENADEDLEHYLAAVESA